MLLIQNIGRKSVMVDLGVRLQQLRMDRNMSQSELGKALNRSKSVISAYENDLRY